MFSNEWNHIISIISLFHPIVTYCHLCIDADTQARYEGSLPSEEVSVERERVSLTHWACAK